MEQWKKCKIRDIVEVNAAQYTSKDNWEKALYLDTGNITENKIDEMQEFDCSSLPSRARRKVKHGDIIFSTVRPNQKHYGYITNPVPNLLVSTGFAVISVNQELANSKFIYYWLSQDEIVEYLHNIAEQSVSAYPSIKASDICNLEIKLPPLEYQSKVASILSTLENKISLNHRINRNLEQQAQALFKAWFVDFEPFDKNTNGIPYNWEKISLSDIMDYSGGSQPPASEFINTYKDGYIRFIQIRDYASNSHITYIPISPRNKLCQKEDIMIARYGASLGRICYGLEGAYNVALAKVIPKRPYYREFLRCYLSCNDFYEGINKKGNRAVQAGFNQSDINSFEVWVPQDNNILEIFEEICHNLFKARMYNDEENERLSKLRDTLLPRLMSGELYVNTITE